MKSSDLAGTIRSCLPDLGSKTNLQLLAELDHLQISNYLIFVCSSVYISFFFFFSFVCFSKLLGRVGQAYMQQELFLQYPHVTSNLTLMLFVLSSLVYLKQVILEVIQSFHKKIEIL